MMNNMKNGREFLLKSLCEKLRLFGSYKVLPAESVPSVWKPSGHISGDPYAHIEKSQCNNIENGRIVTDVRCIDSLK